MTSTLEDPKLAFIYANQAAKIARSTEDTVNVSLMAKRIRAFMFLGKMHIEMKSFSKGISIFDSAVKSGLVQLSVLGNHSIPKTNEVKV